MELVTRTHMQTQAADLHVTGRSPDFQALTPGDGSCTVLHIPLEHAG